MSDWQADVTVTVTLSSERSGTSQTCIEVGMTVPVPSGGDALVAETVGWCGRAAAAAVAEKWRDAEA